ncbi:MAG: M48 family metallopeptidase [Kiritimatiellae bacterium]|nr:M48 family metallopeptidase [Kiritimatiellia bacterium]
MSNRSYGAYFMIIAVLAMISAGCRTVPGSGRTQLMLSTESSENEAGLTAYNEYKTKYKVATNTSQQKLLNQVGAAIKDAAGDTGFDWEFNVLESDTINAFCLPGGKVAVYTGIMPKFANEAEMACVVAHEVAHAIARHGGERQSWSYMQAIGSLGISCLGSSAANTLYELGSEYGVMLPYSRKHETEADLIGLDLMAKAGYDPKAAISFWKKFNTGNSSKIDELMSTHPCDDTRVADLSARLADAEAIYAKAANKKGLGVTITNGIPQL